LHQQILRCVKEPARQRASYLRRRFCGGFLSNWHEGMDMDSNGILRTGACAWLVTLLALLAPGLAGAGEFDPFFKTSFAPPATIARWAITAGNWQFANEEFVSGSTSALSIATVPIYDPDIPPHDTLGGDLSLEVFLAIGSSAATARAGAVFEFADANNYHEVTISATGSVELRSRIAGANRVVATATAPAPGLNKWVHLELVRASDRTTVKIDGVRVFDNVLQDGLPDGDIGLLTRSSSARFDDLTALSFGDQNDPYSEDFDDGVASLWDPLSGTWSAATKVYTSTSVVATAITSSPLRLLWDTDESPFQLAYTFKVRMLNPYGGSGNLVGLAWVESSGNYTEAVFAPTGEARMNRVINGVRTTIATAQYAGAGANRWFEVEVENDGDQPQMITRIKVNGVTLFDTAPNVVGGQLSLITHWAPGRFDDVRAAARFLRPFFEDFDDLFAPQFNRPPSWRLENGMMNSTDVIATDRLTFDQSAGWHDLADSELRARLVNRFANSGNVVGFTYGEHAAVFYEALFSPTGVAQLRRVIKGVPTTLATASYQGGAQNQAFDAQLIQIGERTTVKVNGVPVFENVLQPEAVGGRLGFVSHWTRVRIDDVTFAQIAPTRYRLTALTNLANPFGPRSIVNALNDRGEAVGLSRQTNGQGTAVLWRNGSVTPLGGGNGSEALGINNKSEIVGTNTGQHGFYWKSGVITDLGASPDTALPHSAARDINEHGQIAGSSCGQNGCPALLWQPDHTIVLLDDIPGGIVWGDAFAINESGEAVGQSINVDDGFAAASWRNGTVEPLATGRGSAATDINDRGQIVGFAQSLFQTAVIWQDHEMSLLPKLPTRQESVAQGLNEHATIVGWNTRPATSLDEAHAVVWHEGRVADLNDLVVCGGLPQSFRLKRAEDINERGEIAVNAIDTAADLPSNERAFILTPVSKQEPCN
jgi:hypothetical protein